MDENTIKRAIGWAIGVGVALLLIVGIVILAQFVSAPAAPSQNGSQTTGGQNTTTGVGSGSQTTVTNNNQTGSSTGGTATDTLSVTGQDGSTIVVKDFKNDPNTQADTNNAGQYYLSGGTSPTPTKTPYSIFYVDSNQSFNITLLQEPIKDTRTQAEQELMQKLGIGQQAMCSLNYSVGVPSWVNSIYAGKNLGFSFCPGAVVLP